jgi:hypothetical protein
MKDHALLPRYSDKRRSASVTARPFDDSRAVQASIGCGLGAACEAAFGLWSLALPAGLALPTFAMGFAVAHNVGAGA